MKETHEEEEESSQTNSIGALCQPTVNNHANGVSLVRCWQGGDDGSAETIFQ
jgi:hypothetical protein